MNSSGVSVQTTHFVRAEPFDFAQVRPVEADLPFDNA